MTFTIKTRGSRGGVALAEYMCPEHGRFEQLVDRDDQGNPPETIACACGVAAEWTISAPSVHTQFVVTASKGKNDAKPHKYSMDTRLIAEGRKNDFRKQRKQVREELRHKRVKALLE